MERSADVSGRLDKRQQQIEELSDTRLLLRRLQAVYELPKKIRAALDSGKLEVAVDAHADVLPLLRAHGHKVLLGGGGGSAGRRSLGTTAGRAWDLGGRWLASQRRPVLAWL